MNKKVKILIGIICGILVLLQFTSLLGWLKLYTNSTIANEPNLKFESRMLVSNLISPSNGDFVCYNYEDEYLGMGIRVHRLIAKEGDIVEIINGEAYVNEINVDKSLNLMHLYIIDSVQFNTAKRNGLIDENTIGSMSHSNEFIITFDDRVAKEYGLKNRVINKDSIPRSNIQSKFNKSWSKDNFGPIKVPKNKIFVLGDNRDNTIDSRTIGFVDREMLVGSIVYY